MGHRASLKLGILGAILALSGCGIIYTSPSVRTEGAGFGVDVVPVTQETLAFLNQNSHTPRGLPLYFHQVAGGASPETVDFPDAPDLPEIVATPVRLTLPPPLAATPYRIGVGDVVLLSAVANASTEQILSNLIEAQNGGNRYLVRQDGAISIPGVGDVVVADLTLSEAQNRLFDAMVIAQIAPNVSMSIREFNSQKIVVGGAVAASRVVPVTMVGLTLAEAIELAGGITVRDKALAVIRLYRDGALFQIPVTDYLADPEIQVQLLKDRDAIYVDRSYDLDRALEFYRQNIDLVALRTETREQTLRELIAEIDIHRDQLEERRTMFALREGYQANPRDYVYVTGEVARQVRHPMPYDQRISLADVLFEAGGVPVVTGDVAQIYVLRLQGQEESNVMALHLDAENAAMMRLAAQVELRPNDIIFVEEQVITKWSRALAQTLPSLLNAAALSVVR